MALTPVNYTDGQTVITADNLNAIQAEIISQASTKAPKASPALTGTPTAPTAAATVNNTQIATTAFSNRAAANAVKQVSNPNLLRNWYFVGGGSQLGTGFFPINQRGQDSYDTTGFTIDLWRNYNHTTISCQADALRLTRDSTSANSSTVVRQYLLDSTLTGEETVTASVLVKAVTGSFVLSFGSVADSGKRIATPTITAPGLYTITGAPGAASDLSVTFFTRSAGESSIDISAIKLELGDTQTLAHQENGEWVLNEVPDFGQEMRKCQRYFYRIYGPGSYGYMYTIGYGFANTSNVVRITIPLPVPMAATPTFATESALRFFHGNSTIEISNPTFTVYVARNNMPQIILNITDSDSGSLFTRYEPVTLGLYASSSSTNFADISCEP